MELLQCPIQNSRYLENDNSLQNEALKHLVFEVGENQREQVASQRKGA